VKSRLTTPSLRRRALLKWCLVAGTAAAALAVDLVTKYLADQRLPMGEIRRILPFFYLQRSANDGVAFGLLGGKSALIAVANVLALVVVGVYVHFERRPLLGIAGGAVVGGSLGNMVQRLSGDGHVTDFMKFPHWPFNMADVFIDAGIAAIFLALVVEAARMWRAGRHKAASS
jgi:signal peptidase II